jgi:hypothetical protein
MPLWLACRFVALRLYECNTAEPSVLTNTRGTQFLFLEPNASDPLNKEAAEDLRNNREGFRRNARTAMGGGAVKGQSYDRVLR